MIGLPIKWNVPSLRQPLLSLVDKKKKLRYTEYCYKKGITAITKERMLCM